MKTSPCFTPSERTEDDAAPADGPCNIVTFYEDIDGAVRAERAFDAVVQHFSPDRPTHASSWSFSMLGMPELNASVILDATLADVLVIAAKGDRPVPPRIAAWVEMCMNKSKKAHPAVVALHDDGMEPEGAASPLCSSLEKVAHRQGATFMCSRDLKACGAGESTIGADEDRLRGPFRIPGETPFPNGGCYRWWGIND